MSLPHKCVCGICHREMQDYFQRQYKPSVIAVTPYPTPNFRWWVAFEPGGHEFSVLQQLYKKDANDDMGEWRDVPTVVERETRR